MPDERPSVFVHLLPNLIPKRSLRSSVAIVVDVLRATTVMIHALASGCKEIIPCSEIDEARSIAEKYAPGSALLAGERGGLPIPGFDLGNSPGEFTREVCEGKTVVMTTTNGTRAILASLEAEEVYIAGFVNLKAICDELIFQLVKKDHGHPVHIICSGTEGFISFEDSLLAGALTKNLTDFAKCSFDNSRFGNDEALIALSQWLEVEKDLEQRPLSSLLGLGRGGRNVIRIGRGHDIVDAAYFDRFKVVGKLSRDPLSIVAV